MQWIIATGNPFDGIEMIGPFADEAAALEYAELVDDSRDWWVTALIAPDFASMLVDEVVA